MPSFVKTEKKLFSYTSMSICPHLHALGDPTWPPAAPLESIGLPEVYLQPCEDISILKYDQNGAAHLCIVTPKIFWLCCTGLSYFPFLKYLFLLQKSQVHIASLTP